MTATKTKKSFLIIAAAAAAGIFSVSSFAADVDEKGAQSQKFDSQTEQQRLIENRQNQIQQKEELRDAVKSGASQEELEKRKQKVKEGKKATVQDKKDLREQKLGSTEDQNDAKQSIKSSKDGE